MSLVTFRIDGLDELRELMRRLPEEFKDEAVDIVLDEGNTVMDVVGAYYAQHAKSGNLQGGLTLRVSSAGPFGVGAVVKSNSKHAWLFDNGSQARRYVTKGGKDHATGRMWSKTPARPIFAGSMARARRRMWGKFRELLERHGLSVSGDAG